MTLILEFQIGWEWYQTWQSVNFDGRIFYYTIPIFK